ncbi:MAG: IclR family transcriptional regulator, partial [Betaproteobacteria bacterium]|nr:IclR family transcriptional regulator [Betaproteobacteria bacterium]
AAVVIQVPVTSLARLTPHTVTDTAGFIARVEQARAQDWCWASEEHELGVQAIAVPLRDMRGRTVAALNAVSSVPRLQPSPLRHDILPLLLEAARELRPLL